MNRLISAVIVLLLVSTPALADESLLGSYKLIGVFRELDGKPEAQPQAPHGYLVITPKIYVLFFTDAGRKYGDSDAEKAALWGTMTAHAGTYRIDGNKIVILPDASVNEILTGTQQLRHWQIEGKHLSLASEPRPYRRDPSKKVVSRTEWERIEWATGFCLLPRSSGSRNETSYENMFLRPGSCSRPDYAVLSSVCPKSSLSRSAR